MDKKKQMNFNLNNFLLAVTNILDTRDIEKNAVTKYHSLRIAYVSLKIGQELKLEPKMMFDLCAYSLFHYYINDENIKILGIDNSSNMLSEITTCVHAIDEKYDLSTSDISNRKKIIDLLNDDNINIKYDDILLELCSSIDFWMDCQTPELMLHYIYSNLYDFTEVLTFEEVLKKTSMFGRLYDEVDSLLDKCKKMISFYNFEEKDKWTFLIAASMVNFGKLSVPTEIIHKKTALTSDEYELLKSNVYHNKNALQSIYGFNDISKWATRHQEQLDGNGYPSRLKASELSLKDRLMAVLNIYNSLVSEKSYRKKLSHEKSIQVLSLMAKNYHLDKAIVEDVAQNIA